MLAKPVLGEMKEWEKLTSRGGGEPEDDVLTKTNQSELARSHLRLETGRKFPTLGLCVIILVYTKEAK